MVDSQTSESSLEIAIAYFLPVHKNPAQVERLLRAIYDHRNFYLMHLDRKTPSHVFKGFQSLANCWPNVQLMNRFRITWGSWSQVAIELRAIEQLLRWSNSWKFYINISGQDFPLVSQTTIKRFLACRPGVNMLEVEDPYVVGMAPENRAEFRLFEKRWQRFYIGIRNPLRVLGLISIPFVRRKFPAGVKWYRGSSWKILNRAFCDYVANSDGKLLQTLVRFFRFSECSDEMFFHTLIMNSPFPNTLINDNKRFIVWPGPKLLSMEDYEKMRSSGCFFARKFDVHYDPEILDVLERDLKTQTNQHG